MGMIDDSSSASRMRMRCLFLRPESGSEARGEMYIPLGFAATEWYDRFVRWDFLCEEKIQSIRVRDIVRCNGAPMRLLLDRLVVGLIAQFGLQDPP